MVLLSKRNILRGSIFVKGIQYSSERHTNAFGDFVYYAGDFMGIVSPYLVASTLNSLRLEDIRLDSKIVLMEIIL